MEAKAAARGDEETRTLILWQLGSLEWLAGRWAGALEHVTSAHELGEQTQFFHRLGWAGRIKAVLETDLGLVEDARATAEAGREFAVTYSLEFFSNFALGALGRLELALGNLEAAGSYLRELPKRLLAGGLNDPTPPVWADAIETLIGLGELEQARDYLEPYERYADRLGSPQARVGAVRSRGLLSSLHHLLRDRLELELTRPELVRVRDATAGNPFFALELGRELVRTGTRPTPGEALRVPESLRELLGDRLARLPAETVDVLVQVAV